MYIILYPDNLIIYGNDMNDITNQKRNIFYLLNVLKRFNIGNCSTVETPA